MARVSFWPSVIGAGGGSGARGAPASPAVAGGGGGRRGGGGRGGAGGERGASSFTIAEDTPAAASCIPWYPEHLAQHLAQTSADITHMPKAKQNMLSRTALLTLPLLAALVSTGCARG